MLSPISLFLAQVLAHLSLIPMILYGEIFHWAICFFIYFLSGCFGMTMTYHRLLAHKSWKAPLWFRYFGLFCATIGLTGSAISWVAIHRKHHRHTDTPEDPHSPTYKGFWFCHFFSMFAKVELKYVRDLLASKTYRLQHRFYFYFSAFYASLLFFIDPLAIVYAWLAPACILWNAGSSIISISHMGGKNPHHLESKAGNNWLLGLLVWGEGWHNNHHFRPTSPQFSSSPWQVDIGGFFIKLIGRPTRP